MYVVPTLEDFQSDLLTIYVNENYFLRLYIVDEYVSFNGVTSKANGIVMEAVIVSNEQSAVVKCPSIIGLKNDIVEIKTDNGDMLGKIMDVSNLGSWGLEIVE